MSDTFIYQKDGEYVQVTEKGERTPLLYRPLGVTDVEDLTNEQAAMLDQARGDAFEVRLTTYRTTLSDQLGVDPRVLQQATPRNAVPAGSQTPSHSTPLPPPAPQTSTPSTGGTPTTTSTPTSTSTPSTGGGGSTGSGNSSTGDTFRVRLSHLPGANNPYPGILKELANTRGLLFPYTPTIAFTQEVEYQPMSMVHSNTDYQTYARTPNVSLSLTAKFTVQNRREGIYALAAIHFMRSVSKMYFGEKDADAGLAGIPPPVLLLDGYGPYMFNKVRCVVKSHSWTFDENMQMVSFQSDDGKVVRLPPMFTMSVSLTVQQTARAMRKDFRLDDFKSGALMSKEAGGWI